MGYSTNKGGGSAAPDCEETALSSRQKQESWSRAPNLQGPGRGGAGGGRGGAWVGEEPAGGGACWSEHQVRGAGMCGRRRGGGQRRCRRAEGRTTCGLDQEEQDSGLSVPKPKSVSGEGPGREVRSGQSSLQQAPAGSRARPCLRGRALPHREQPQERRSHPRKAP